MKQKYFESQIKKNGLLVFLNKDCKTSYTMSPNDHATAEWHIQDDEVVCLKVRYVHDENDYNSDYHAGSFYDTAKGAIEALFRMDKNAEDQKIKAESMALNFISIERLEGPSSLCVKTEFSNLKDAQCFLDDQITTCPKEGYDKHRVTLRFKDGIEYIYRADLVHYTNVFFRQSEFNIKLFISESLKSYEIEKDCGDVVQLLRKIKNRLNQEEV